MFIFSVILMVILIAGIVVTFCGVAQNLRGKGNPWVVLIGFCMCGISTMILCAGMGDLFKIFFSTIFGKDKK